MKYLLLLLCLIVVPAWADSAMPSASDGVSAPSHPHKKHKGHKKHEADKQHGDVSEGGLTCLKQTCSGKAGCFQPRCGAVCVTPC